MRPLNVTLLLILAVIILAPTLTLLVYLATILLPSLMLP
jgi:hypothetical protein